LGFGTAKAVIASRAVTVHVARSHVSVPVLATVAVVALALMGTVLLWAHYGTTVFFETIRVGFSACFG